MEQKLKADLEGVFAAHKLATAKQKDTEERRATESFDLREQFKNIASKTIDPALVEIGKMLLDAGYFYEIEKKFDGDGGTRNSVMSSIGIKLSTKKITLSDQFPSISFIHDYGSKAVRIHRNTISPGRGGISGSEGSMSFDQIDTATIQSKVVELIKIVFG